MLCILGVSILYFLVIVIWWEIVDYNEFKFTKEEKLEKKTKRINNNKLLLQVKLGEFTLIRLDLPFWLQNL